MAKVSCIIATYNEEKRIGFVLGKVYKHPLINEIIVVDDGSTDNTKDVLRTFPDLKIVSYGENRGKSFAVKRGLEESSGDIILLVDADLVGLAADDITRLLDPVLKGEADISISLRKNAPIFWKLIGLDYISGERVFHKSFLVDQSDNLIKLPGFGLEVFMNQLLIKKRYRIKIVPWPNVSSPEKFKKRGLKLGIIGEIGMFKDIFKTVSLFRIVRQIITMSIMKI